MKRFFQSEAGAAVLWVLSSMLLAAILAPWVYQAGKALAAAAASRELPGVLEWLGAACGKSKFARFYSRALSFSAVLFLPFLFRRIRRLRARGERPKSTNTKVVWKSGPIQILIGWVIAGGLLWSLVMMLQALGVYTPDPHPPKISKFLTAVLIPTVAAPLLEELVFRGLLLGIWLKSARPLMACVGTSLFFAFLHFLEPPIGFAITDPGAPTAGFELLGRILIHFTDPRFFVTDFATLFVVGMILAWARLRTGALWFSIGLHAGWVMVFKTSNLLFVDVPGHPLRPWGVGQNIRSGLLPMITLGLTAVLCHFVLRRFEAPRQNA
ncbi:MAG: CPBP family intramembrane glutamic endopeptidase [Luteolibacter sp.]